MVLIAGAIGCTGIYISSLIPSFYGFMFCYCGAVAFANGLTYSVPLHVAWAYFPGREGLMSGIIIGSYGLGGVIFNFVSTALVNPEFESSAIHDEHDSLEYPFPDYIGDNTPGMLRNLSIIWASMMLMTLLILQTEPNSNQEIERVSFSSIFKYLRTSQFITIYTMNVLTIFFGTFIVGSYHQYGETALSDEKFFTSVGAVASFAGCMRFIWSFAADHYSFKTVYGVMIGIQIVLAFTFSLVINSKPLFMIWVAIAFWVEGGHFTLAPTVYKKLFGAEGTRVFGFGFTFVGLASILKLMTMKALLESIGFDGIIRAYGALTILALVILLTFFDEKVLLQ